MKTIGTNVAKLVFLLSVLLLVFWPFSLIFGLPPFFSGDAPVAPPFDAFAGLLNYYGAVFYPVIVIVSIIMIITKKKQTLALFLPVFYLGIIILMFRLMTIF